VARAAAAAGAPEPRLRTVPVPVDPADPAPRPAWADGRPVVGFVGRVEPRKGVLDLLHAMPRVAEQVDDVRLVIVRGPALEPAPHRRTVRRRAQGASAGADSSGEYERRVAEAAAALGDRVVLTGPVADARALMPWFDVLCVPSLAEPFGTVAAEALAAGTPAVVTDSGGMPEYVVPGRNGEVVPPGDPEQLATALARILPRAGELREASRESVARFRTPRAAREMAALLREAAGR
jgi:glycosyltransferase involved in cell wall biosynthesis